jgi:hypothetical protein
MGSRQDRQIAGPLINGRPGLKKDIFPHSKNSTISQGRFFPRSKSITIDPLEKSIAAELRRLGNGRKIVVMADVSKKQLNIDLGLRFALFGLECALGVSFSGAEWEHVFLDAEGDQVSAKQYVFFESLRLSVTGRVDEYEPERIWIEIKGVPDGNELLTRVAEGVEFQLFRVRQSQKQ